MPLPNRDDLWRRASALPVVFLFATLLASSAAAADGRDRVLALIAEGDTWSAEAVRRFDLALPRYQEATRAADSVHDPPLAARAWQRLGQALWDLDRLPEAVSAAERARDLARVARAPEVEADALRTLGAALLQLARFDEAEETLHAAADLSARLGRTDAQARAVSNLSANARLQGRFGAAIGFGRAALAILDRATGAGVVLSPRVQFAVPFNLGKALADSGDYLTAWPYLDRAFTAAEKNGDLGGQGHVLHDTAAWYEAQGDIDRAARFYTRSLDHGGRIVAAGEEVARGHQGLGSVAEARGDPAAAVAEYQAAIAEWNRTGIRTGVAELHVAFARALFNDGRVDEASVQIAEAIAEARAANQPAALANALVERGRELAATGRPGDAAQLFRDAVTQTQRHRLLPIEPAAWVGLGHVLEAVDEAGGALDAYRQAANAVDRLRGRIVSTDLRVRFASAAHETFAGLARVLLDAHAHAPRGGFDRLALLALERERSQNLLMAVDEASAATESSSRPSGAARVANIQNVLFSPELIPARRDQLLRELDDAERDMLTMDQARTGRPSHAIDWNASASLTAMQQALSPGEIAIEYSLPPGPAAAFVVTSERVDVVPLSLPADLGDRVEFFVRAIKESVSEAVLASGGVLARALVDPVLARVPPGSRLLIAAAGPLAGLPFGALPIGGSIASGQPLMAHHEVVYIPSLALFAAGRSGVPSAPSRGVFALASATAQTPGARFVLSATIAEARAAASLAPHSDLRLAGDATETAVKQAPLAEYAVVHFATHAMLDARVPERSAVLLTRTPDDDGLLQPREIYGLRLGGALVVLSGCETAAGRVSAAEGLHGVARAFLFAGSRAVVGTLWDVEDRATARLMIHMYQELAVGRPIVSALRVAQLAVAGQRPYEHSAAWAPFLVMGDPAITIAPTSRSGFDRGLAAVFAGVVVTLFATALAAVRATKR